MQHDLGAELAEVESVTAHRHLTWITDGQSISFRSCNPLVRLATGPCYLIVQQIVRLYLIVISIGAFGTLLILHAGNRLAQAGVSKTALSVTHVVPREVPTDGGSFIASVLGRLRQNASDDLSRFFLQLSVVIGVS